MENGINRFLVFSLRFTFSCFCSCWSLPKNIGSFIIVAFVEIQFGLCQTDSNHTYAIAPITSFAIHWAKKWFVKFSCLQPQKCQSNDRIQHFVRLFRFFLLTFAKIRHISVSMSSRSTKSDF